MFNSVCLRLRARPLRITMMGWVMPAADFFAELRG
jgi:hypothetical protein